MAAQPAPLFTNLRFEEELLLCCARTQLDAPKAARVTALLQEELDWDYLLDLAFGHHLAALVYRHLEAENAQAIPEWVRAGLKWQIQSDIQGNLLLTRELLHVLALFAEQAIPVVPYKGAVLTLAVYGDLALRSFGDLDLFVQEADVLRAWELLTAAGYQVIRPTELAELDAKRQPPQIQQLVADSPWAYQLVMGHPSGRFVIELHWRLTPKYVFPHAAAHVWQALTPVQLNEVPVRSFAPEDLLWFLCLHGSKHQWERLGWLCDIGELIRAHPQLDWALVHAHAQRMGLTRRLYLGLYLVQTLLHVPLPATVQRQIETTPHVKTLAQRVVAQVFTAPDAASELAPLKGLAFHLRAMDHMADRVRYCAHTIRTLITPVAPDREMLRLPSVLSPFYYLLRPIRLATKYGQNSLSRLRSL
ncbi:MAG: nucleotidyltransferase family protein [Caldilineaceae bacterium]